MSLTGARNTGWPSPSRDIPEPGPVLVVDDDDSIREMLVDILAHDGYRVAGARDGMEALAAIERERPSVILLDLLMPMLDGRSVANALRDNGIRVPVVVMTASDPAESRELAMDGFVSKPFDLQEILAAVRRFHPKPRATGPRAGRS